MASVAEHPEQVRTMGGKAVARAERYSWKHFVDRLDEYVEQHC